MLPGCTPFCQCTRRSWTSWDWIVRIVLVNEFVQHGDRMFVQCEGGPCLSRLDRFSPQLEIEERGDMYVLIDQGEPQERRCLFLPNSY